ncbi:MAG: hypothetical protein ACKOWE_01165 [Micrococcales bacterium]
MISTIAAVVAFGSLFGYIDPATCVNEQVEGWTSCEAAARQSLWTFWIALAIAIASYGSYRVRKYLYAKTSDN